ncbi:MAG: YihY/virulence factor BrkB family protein [Pseudomonadota bacterium]
MAAGAHRSKYTASAGASSGVVGPRGHNAAKPTQIPAKGWKDIGLRVFGELSNDRVMLVAAGVTYYLLLALVPALTATVSIYGLFSDPTTVAQQVDALKGIVPGGGIDLLNEQLTRLTEQGDTTLGFTFIFSLLVALWSTNAGMKALFDAMNIAYDERESRSFIRLTLLSLGFTLLTILGAITLISVTIVLPTVLAFLPFGQQLENAIRLASYALALVAALGFVCALYRYGPSRDSARWRWITPGAIVATVLVIVVSVGFSFYVSNFGSYNATYGSLGALIGFLTWIWIMMIVLIMGAELNAEMEHQTRRDTTTGQREPMGERGAHVADHVPASVVQESAEPGRARSKSAATPASPSRRPGLSQLAVMVPLAIAVGVLTKRD